jgi:hypothetical protein
MTVKELIEILKELNDNLEVKVASDEEGNSISGINAKSIEIGSGEIIIYPW